MQQVTFQAFYLHFDAPLLLSQRGAEDALTYGEVYIPSDTLSAAMAHVLSLAGALPESAQVKDFLEQLYISSAFPCIAVHDAEGKILKRQHFFPTPPLAFHSTDITIHKKVKKIRWAEQALWQELLQHGKINLDENPQEYQYRGPYIRNRSNDPVQPPLPGELIQSTERMRVRVPRSQYGSNATRPFMTAGYAFQSMRQRAFDTNQEVRITTGLFFLLHDPDGTLTPQVRSALDVLQYMGIGSDKNVGLGSFRYQSDTITLHLPDAHADDQWLNLSMYLPETKAIKSDDEENKKKILHESVQPISFQLTLRSGWVTHLEYLNFRRKGLYMFKEGSLFRFADLDSPNIPLKKGRVQNVTPKGIDDNTKIFRSGKCLFVPYNASNAK